ncbi:MAG TPA: peptide deformylase [Candidatus Merdicola faecigallinarum]|uniref:Peptide deformylase n=1 Tax=Candidatus Merdicola faecigallinarum TaxID=2840862 RepID=A0A9D1M003_9FIRM|nr:peptide deformylase [Candidatus Merdicola faecigallinarum]
MAIRNIRENGDEILRKRAKEVDNIKEERIQILIDDMIETVHAMNGVGLAAQQVGVLKRIVVIDIYDGNGPVVLINPVILKTKGEHEVEEGCLSFPNQYAKLIRPKEVEVEAFNREGEKIRIKAKDLFAQAICHETDHLNGELFVDKMLPGTLQIVKPEEIE